MRQRPALPDRPRATLRLTSAFLCGAVTLAGCAGPEPTRSDENPPEAATSPAPEGDVGATDYPTPPVSDAVASTRVPGYPIGLTVARDGGVWAVATQAGAVRHLSLEHHDGPRTASAGAAEPWVDRSTRVGDVPLRAVDTPDGLWVSVFGAGVLRRLDPRLERVGSFHEPEGLARAGDSLWVVDQARSEAVELRLPDATVARRVEVGTGPRLVHAGASGVWVSSYGAGTVTRVDGPRPVTRTVCDGPQGMVEAAGRLWVACSLQDSLVGLDAQTLRPEVRLNDVVAVDALAATRDSVLALLPDGPTVVAVDPEDGTERGRVRMADAPPVGDGNVDLLVHRDRVWASSPMTDEVLTLSVEDLP